MAKDVERLVLELSADVSRLERGLKNGQAITARQTRAIERQFDQMNKRSVGSVTAMSSGIKSALGGIALAAAAREVQQYADTWTRATNQLLAAGNSQEQAGAKLDQLTNIALRSRSSLEGTITLYNRLISVSGDLGVSQERVARVVETVNKALATSNMTSGERASSITQLAQGLGSGTLAGDELKAIRENSQALSQAIADEFGVSIGELKKLGEEGALTSARVFRGLEKATANVETAFGKTRATVDDAFTNLQTKTIQFIGQLDASTGASAKLASVIGFVANHLDDIAAAAGIAAVAVGTGYATAMAVAGARTVAATVSTVAYQIALIRLQARQTGATAAQVALNAALTANPIGLVVVAVAALAAGLVFLESKYGRAEVAARELNEVQAQTSGFLDRYRQAQFDAANATDANKDAALRHVEALKKEGAEIVNVARLNAQRRINEATQARRTADRFIQANNQRQSGQGERSFSNASVIQDQAARQQARTAISQATDARKDADAAIKELTSLQQQLAAPPPSTSVNSTAATERAGGSEKKGPSPEDVERTRQLLTLDMARDRLAAQGRTYDAEQVQAAIDKINLAQRLKEAQVANPEQEAARQVDFIRQAEAAERGRATALEQSKFFIDAATEALAAYNEEQDRSLQVQIDLARIEGNDIVVRMLERELRLREQINALGPNASQAQRDNVRRDEAVLNRAEDRRDQREQADEAARTFIDVIRADDIGTEMGQRFRQAAFDKLQDVLGNLFDRIWNGGGAQGGGIENTVVNAISGFFGGKRALGGPVQQGKFYKVNENTGRSEFFAPGQDGFVGNVKTPRATSKGTAVSIRQGDITIIGQSDAQLRAYVQQTVAASQRQTVQLIKAGAPSAQLEQQLLRD